MTASFMESDLLRSGLVPPDLDATETFDAFGGASRYRIPYYYPNGTPHPMMQRERLSNPLPDGGKYDQPKKEALVAAGHPESDATYPYLNRKILRNTTWAHLALSQTVRRWVLAEGEKKAVCIGKYCLRPAIGIGGCWNGVHVGKAGLPFLHPVLAAMIRAGDAVDVVLDADMFTNPNVNLAAGTLRRALLLHGAKPTFVLVPMHGGIDTWLLTIDPAQRAKAFDDLPRSPCNKGELRENYPLLYHVLGLPLTEKGKLCPTEDTAQKILERHERYKGQIWVEDTRDQMMESVTTGKPQAMTDNFAGREVAWIQAHVGQALPMSRFSTALYSLAAAPEHHRNAIHDYLRTLTWDGKPRVEEMFMRGWGADNTIYTRAIGRAWLLSAVARAMRPGCEMQTMLVLEGAQGIGKSRSLKLIGGEWYTETATKMDSKDFILEAHRSWLFDLAELGAYKFADFSFAKALLSTAIDMVRAPYARMAEIRPRRFVPVATTNEAEYLRDLTGNRRFWPMKCGAKIDLDWIAENRDQLFAEAKEQYAAGEAWWVDDAITAPIQNSRVVVDPWIDRIRGTLAQVTQTPPLVMKGASYYFVATYTILQSLDVPPAQANVGHYQRIKSLMHHYFSGWEHYQYDNTSKLIMVNGTLVDRARGYRKPETNAAPASNVINIAPQA